MSARDMVHTRNGVRMTSTVLCQWKRAPQGGLRATWRPGLRVAPGNDTEHNARAAVRLPREGQHVHAASRNSEQPSRTDRWIAGSFITALYALIAFAGVVIVVRL